MTSYPILLLVCVCVPRTGDNAMFESVRISKGRVAVLSQSALAFTHATDHSLERLMLSIY